MLWVQAGGLGVEPRFGASKAHVLPLDEPPLISDLIVKLVNLLLDLHKVSLILTVTLILLLLLPDLDSRSLPGGKVPGDDSVDADEDQERDGVGQEEADRERSKEPDDGQPSVNLAEHDRIFLNARP
jgi:hypothetical protein